MEVDFRLFVGKFRFRWGVVINKVYKSNFYYINMKKEGVGVSGKFAIFILFLFFSAFVSSTPNPIVHYAFNSANGTYNSTFLEDISGNGRNITGTFPGVISTIRTGYLSYSNGSGSSSNFNIPSFSTINTKNTDITLDFYIDRGTYSQNYLWNFNIPSKTYNSSGSVIANSPVIAVYLTKSNNKLYFGASTASTGYLNITVPKIKDQDHIVLRIRNGTISVFHEGSYLGNMSSDVTGTYPWNTNISNLDFTSFKLLSGTTSSTTYIGYQTGDFKLYNQTMNDSDALTLTSSNDVSWRAEGLLGYFSLNGTSGMYNSTYLEDLSANGFHATRSSSVSNYTISNLSASNNLIYEKNENIEDGFNPSIPGLIANSNYIIYDFYVDLYDRNAWFAFWKGVYTYNDSLTSSSNFLVTREGMSVGLPAGYLRVNFQSLGYAQANLIPGKRYAHVILNFNASDYQIYQDGYKLDSVLSSGLTDNNLQSLSFSETKLISGKNSTSYSTRTLGPIKIYRAMNYNEEDLVNLSLQNELDSYENLINITFPHDNNVVVQRDTDTNKGNLTIEFSNYFNVRKMNISITGRDLIEVDIINQTLQTYVFENLDPGCYNITLFTGENSRNLTNYCIGEVIAVMGQSNSMMYGDGFNYSKVGVNLTSDNLVMAYTVPNPNHQYHVMHISNYFNSSNTTWYAGAWARLAFNISNELDMPVMVYDIGVGGTPINEFIGGYAKEYMDWNNNYVMKYDNKVAFVVWMQGEADETTTNYTDYVYQLTETWQDMFDIQYEDKYMLVVPGNYQASTEEVCPLPTAADKSWAQYSMFNLALQNLSYFIPSVILDIETNNIQNCIHMADVEFDALQFATRVSDGIMTYVYNKSYLDRPNITDIFIYNETTLGIKYDRSVKFENSHGVTGLLSEGFRLYDSSFVNWYDAGNISNVNLVSTTIADDNIILNTYNISIFNMTQASFCARQIDCYNRSIARSNTSSFPNSDMPTPIYLAELSTNATLNCDADGMFWSSGICYSSFDGVCEAQGLVNQSGVCVEEDILEDTNIILSSGNSVYSTSMDNLAKGYTQFLYKNYQIKFSIKNESHNLKVTNVSNGSFTIVVSSTPQIFVLRAGEEKKISLVNSSYYDLLVKLNSVYLNRGNFTIQSINEKIIVENHTAQEINKDVSQPQRIEEETRSFAWAWILIIVLIVLAGMLILLKKHRK